MDTEVTTQQSALPDETTARAGRRAAVASVHECITCHYDMHVDGDSCPSCGGWLPACRIHQTPSAANAKTGVAPVAEAGTPGGEVETCSPAAPSRPGVTPAGAPTGPVPDRIQVDLPVGQPGEACDRGTLFQPAQVLWEAYVHHGRFFVKVTAVRTLPDFQCETFYPDLDHLPGWCPQPPEWFNREAARMRASIQSVERDRPRHTLAELEARWREGVATR